MELFDKIYSCYYQVAASILRQATNSSITPSDIRQCANRYGYEESILTILPKFTDDKWALLTENTDGRYESKLNVLVKTPLTTLQKSWLAALLEDPRIRLFFTDEQLDDLANTLKSVLPLYKSSDFHYFDRCLDGDPYESDSYRNHFRTILTALKEEHFLTVAYTSPKSDDRSLQEVFPMQLQYSAKDDKFRLHGFAFRGRRRIPIVLNVNRFLACHISKRPKPSRLPLFSLQGTETVLIEISGERNSLERCMLHFASYKKHTEYDEQNNVYHCTIYYHKNDEAELLIQLLSFGPVVRVLGPAAFLAQIKERVAKQHEMF